MWRLPETRNMPFRSVYPKPKTSHKQNSMPLGDSLKKEACLSAMLTLNLTFPHIKKHAFRRSPKKEACLSAILTLSRIFPHIKKHAFWRFPKKETCLSAILTLNLKIPHIKKHAFRRFPKKRSMPFGDFNPKPKIPLHKEACLLASP